MLTNRPTATVKLYTRYPTAADALAGAARMARKYQGERFAVRYDSTVPTYAWAMGLVQPSLGVAP